MAGIKHHYKKYPHLDDMWSISICVEISRMCSRDQVNQQLQIHSLIDINCIVLRFPDYKKIFS
jgi:hypothetical protein